MSLTGMPSEVSMLGLKVIWEYNCQNQRLQKEMVSFMALGCAVSHEWNEHFVCRNK